MFRTALHVTTLAAAALLIAGCSTPASTDTGKTPDTGSVIASAPPAESPSPTAEAEFGDAVTSSRGNLIKDIGQLAGTSTLDDDTVTSRFAVTDIVLDYQCDSGFAEKPKNGHFLGIHLNIETTPELAEDPFPWISFTSYDWQAYDADGKRLNDPQGEGWSCLDSSTELPDQIGPGQSVSGWIVLDVAATTGTVALVPMGSATGWEWAY